MEPLPAGVIDARTGRDGRAVLRQLDHAPEQPDGETGGGVGGDCRDPPSSRILPRTDGQRTMREAVQSDYRTTIEAFRAFIDDRPDDEKWELIDGEIVLNPTATNRHQVSSESSLRLRGHSPQYLTRLGRQYQA